MTSSLISGHFEAPVLPLYSLWAMRPRANPHDPSDTSPDDVVNGMYTPALESATVPRLANRDRDASMCTTGAPAWTICDAGTA